MEKWDIYDKNRIKSKRTMERGSNFKEEEFHLVVHICIFNAKNQMLIQQRQPFKHGWPNYWDITVGGSAIEGETSAQAAERELFEEIGLKKDFSKDRPYFTINFEHGFDDYYLIEDDVNISLLQLQFEEVQAVRWANIDEILNMIEQGEFIPYYSNLIKLLFEMRKYRGAHEKN